MCIKWECAPSGELRYHFRLDSLSQARTQATSSPAGFPISLTALLHYPSPSSTTPLFIHHPSKLVTMPPTGSDYPPRKVSINIKVPHVSISSFSAETHRRLLEADRRWRTKCILRTLSAVFSLIGFSLFAAAVPKWNAEFYWGTGPNRGDWEDGFPIGVVGIPYSV